MKKLGILLLSCVTGAALAACGASPTTTTEPTAAVGAATSAVESNPTAADTLAATSSPAMMNETGTTAPDTLEATSSPAAMNETSDTEAGAATSGPAVDIAATVLAAGEQPTPATMGTAAAIATEAAAAAPEASAAAEDVLTAAEADPRFSTFVTAVQAAGLEETLKGAGPYTIFAPTNDAFAALPAGVLEQLLAEPATLEKILTYHVANGKMDAMQVASESTLTTVEGSSINVSGSGSSLQLNNEAKVISTEIDTDNGVIHVIDKVLLPPDVALPAGS